MIDQLVSDGLIPETNQYHYFNGKSLATFTSQDAIREVVYVESRVDTDKDGLPDLVKVSIIRPRYDGKIPAVMTASPYHQGTNDKASDKALYNMNVDLEVKKPHSIQLEEPQLELVEPVGSAQLVDEAEELLTHINSSYTLNDYLLPRGYANLYVSGVGTKDSQGLMTNGNYQQIEAYKNVIDWLNGRCRAFTDHTRKRQVKADWSNGKVATTGISYLGTMSNGLATTGVDGLEVIIAEAGISSWYNYYRENGLITSPGGYPGEDFDSLAELTYSRNLLGGDYLHHNAAHQADLDRVKKSWTALLETTISSGTTAIISYMLIGLRLRWSSLMVPKTGTSNPFTSLICSRLFQQASRNTSSITMVPMSTSTTGNPLTSAKA